MKCFTDNQGRTWQVVVNVNTVKRVRGLVDVNLLEIVDGSLIEKLIADPVLLCDVVYAICKPEADQAGVSDEQFGEAMAGDAIEQATKALLEELVSFSPSPLTRANLQKVLDLTWKMMARANELIAERIETGNVEKAAEQVLATSIGSSGSVPESSGSIPEN